MNPFELLGRLRRPEFTGDNRCVPCTVLNVGIAAVFSLGIAVGGQYVAGTTESIAAGSAVFVCSAVAIYLRGYLLPGTPRLTKTYLPDRILRRFHDRPTGVDDGADLELAMKGVAATRNDREDSATTTDREEDDE